MTLPRLFITPGEPAGIGPDIILQAAQLAWPAELVVIADPDLLLARAKQLQLPLQLSTVDLNEPPVAQTPGTLKICPVKLETQTIAGQLNVVNATYVKRTLDLAAKLALQQRGTAIVTGPVHKGVMNEAGIAFMGHTEYFAVFVGKELKEPTPHTVMLFVVDQLKVALATTHLPLANVPSAITQERLRMTLEILNAGLKRWFRLATPRIYVSGLNPHAGEGGHLGHEEIEVITPLIKALREQGMHLEGPVPADTLFTPHHLANADAILAMYHDQALPIVKFIGFDRAVNVTLGLPFLRTSVDHGTALDLAGTLKANPGSLNSAIQLAIQLLNFS